VSTATWIAAAACALSAALLVGWWLRWALIDARERKAEKEAADRWVAHMRSLRTDDTYLRQQEGRPND